MTRRISPRGVSRKVDDNATNAGRRDTIVMPRLDRGIQFEEIIPRPLDPAVGHRDVPMPDAPGAQSGLGRGVTALDTEKKQGTDHVS